MKHLLSMADLNHEQALKILDIVEAMAITRSRQVKKLPTLRGKTVVNLFFKDSTRTRISFETAAKRLSVDVINFSVEDSSVSKERSLRDTTLTLQTIRADETVIRRRFSGAAYRLAHAEWLDVPVINVGNDSHQHSTQTLLGAIALRRHCWGTRGGELAGKDLKGVRVVTVDDILYPRVARSDVDLMSISKAQATLIGPPTLIPVGVEDWSCGFTYDFDTALNTEPDAVMMLQVQNEGMSATGGGFFPSVGEYHRVYDLDRGRFERSPRKIVITHPDPVNRGMEICAEAANSSQSVMVEQVGNDVNIGVSALYLLLAPEGGLL